MKIRFYTLGCKLNFAETSTFQRDFISKGFEIASKDDNADVVVVNTCSVTADADKKCRNIIRRFVKENPTAVVVVTGCYASLSKCEIEKIEGVSLVIPNKEKSTLVDRTLVLLGKLSNAEIETSYFRAFSSGDRTRSFLKVQDGCSYGCSYCTIPAARGVSRNVSIQKVVEDARKIAELGQQEIVLTGVNIGDFGRTTGERFADLLRELDKVEGINRYRISSIEPNLLTDEIIDFTASSKKFVPHFHIPLQSGCDEVLKSMRRRYKREKFADRIYMVRQKMPDAFFGVDVIVGFPTETEEKFLQTYEFLKEIKPSFLHVFPFSCRPNTVAACMTSVNSFCEKESRVHRLTSLSDELHKEFVLNFMGDIRPVLFESVNRNGMMYGYTDNYIRVEVTYDKNLISRITDVKLTSLTDTNENIVRGELINQ